MTTSAEQESVLLPRSVRPRAYRITLTPDFCRCTFNGAQEIDVEVREETACVVLHSADIEIHSVECVQDAVLSVPVAMRLDGKKETVTFEFAKRLSTGKATLRILFTGELNDRMCGFYRSEYVLNGEKRYMGVTQFEATDARRAFPCWDEPGAKATFEVTLVVPQDRIAISNTHMVEMSINNAGLKVVRFAETPVMSTYLLACIVGEFDCVEDMTREGVQVRVFTPVGKKEQGWFALEVATRTLSFYQDYFGIPYPLRKMDLIAIPDFAAGAMENWGAVTYRETAILVDPKDSSVATRQRVAQVVAHELAHQWFGDLVTMEWWTHLWLNEGFASWIQYLAMDHLFPEWDIWTQFIAHDVCRALRLDGLEHSHAIEIEVGDPGEISEIFDAISYSKGASIIRMLEAFLGKGAFSRGLRVYLSRHQYGNATTDDLWRALSEASGMPVKAIMDGWTKQAGYPVLTVEERMQENGFSLAIRQSRFISSGSGVEGEGGDAQWWIPVGTTSVRSPEPIFLTLEHRSMTCTEVFPSDAWIKVNSGQTGFYRVSYSPELWARIVPVIKTRSLPTADRIGIQNDAFALARAGLLRTDRALALAAAYRNETEYTVWADLSMNLDELGLLLAQGSSHTLFQGFVRSLYRQVAERLGWDVEPGEGHLTTLLRSLGIGGLGHAGDAATIEEAGRRFSEFVEYGRALNPDLRLPVYSIVVECGGPRAHEHVLRIYRRADLHEEKVRCLRALGYAQEPDLLQRTLEFSLSAEVRSQDAVFAIASVALNRCGRELAWQFLQANWAELDRRYGKGGFMLARLISATAENFASEERAREVDEFFRSHTAPAAERTIRQTVERIRSNTLWLGRDEKVIRSWLKEYVSQVPDRR